ncbi:WD40 repeat-like protein [Schizopora paradoxa]|uniref:WD40 repeat-like protein n=1 Tax=Schizopora paradoxa TaxID=27342 RepID=A0A0H2RI90_9AGAM|nr:WD40 repeat-like protein [Schizopora paradoxa]
MKREEDQQQPIVRDRALTGHKSGIQCVAISPDGSKILSGDDDAWLFLWDVKSGEVIQKLSTPFNGAIGAVVWAPRERDSMAFVLGCADGSILLYQEQQNSRGPFQFVSVVESPGPIEGLAYDQAHQRIASVGGGALQVWKISDVGSLVPIKEDPVQKPVVAKNVTFIDDGASVVVFYLESHEISCYAVEPWDLKWSKIVPTRIGHACICMAEGAFLFITNLLDGIDQYRFPSLEKVQSFTHPISMNLPLQVTTAARGQWVLCGGDSGFVRVYSRRTGQIVQVLDHCDKPEAVQVVATHELEDRTLIVTGSSSEGESDLQVWYERIDPPRLPGAFTDSGRANEATFMSTAKAIIIYAFLGVFVMQLLMIGSIYLFWPEIKAIIEALLRKSTLASDPNSIGLTPISDIHNAVETRGFQQGSAVVLQQQKTLKEIEEMRFSGPLAVTTSPIPTFTSSDYVASVSPLEKFSTIPFEEKMYSEHEYVTKDDKQA